MLPGFEPASGADEDFDVFWARYPRKDARKDARKAWNKLAPSVALVEKMLAALAWQTVSEQWTKEDGQFIPLPATWLRGERWTDAQPVPPPQRGPVISQKTATVLRAAANVMARRRQEGF